MLGSYLWGVPPRGDWMAWGGWLSGVLLLSAGAVAIYLAGNLWNDWWDREWDAVYRPERALPSGLAPPVALLVAGLVLAGFGLALGFWADRGSGWACVVIVGLVVVYTWLHKRRLAALVVLAGCRGLLGVAGFLLVEPPSGLAGVYWRLGGTGVHPRGRTPLIELFEHIYPHAFVAVHVLGVFAWTAGLSLTARYESMVDPPTGPLRVGKALLFLPLAAMSCCWIPFYPLAGGLALLPLAVWLGLALTVFRAPLRRFVGVLLAGFPLVDLVAAVPLTLALLPPGGSLFDLPLLATGIVVPVVAFGLGLLLQRVAPAS